MHYAITRAATMSRDSIIAVSLSGRGDKDMETIITALGL